MEAILGLILFGGVGELIGAVGWLGGFVIHTENGGSSVNCHQKLNGPP